MNKFNICNNYITKIQGMVIPKGALYGKDKYGYWVCTQKELYPLDTPTLELYRWNNPEMDWVLTIEQSETVRYISECATKFDLWKVPIEYPKFTGVHEIAKNSSNIVRKHKIQRITSQYDYEHRHDKEQISLDMWESVAPMLYEEKVGTKRIKRPNWHKTQYTPESKPYIVKNVCC